MDTIKINIGLSNLSKLKKEKKTIGVWMCRDDKLPIMVFMTLRPPLIMNNIYIKQDKTKNKPYSIILDIIPDNIEPATYIKPNENEMFKINHYPNTNEEVILNNSGWGLL